jgi:hypothetical protein
MGHAQKSHDGGVQTPPTRKTRNELEELGEENKQQREAVARLSELVLTQIAEAAEPPRAVGDRRLGKDVR